MRAFELNGKNYKIGKILPLQQFHILRRLSPLISVLDTNSSRGQLETLTDSLSKLSDEDSEYVIKGLLSGVFIDNGQGLGHAPLVVEGRIMYQTLNLVEIMTLVFEALRENFLEFLAAAPAPLREKLQGLAE